MELLPIDEKKSRAAAEEVLEQYREKRAIVRMPAMPKLTSSWEMAPRTRRHRVAICSTAAGRP